MEETYADNVTMLVRPKDEQSSPSSAQKCQTMPTLSMATSSLSSMS